jgi:tetratricopeptide (TPR) repeat protein
MLQDPNFERFASAFKQNRFDDALALVDGLIARFPDSPALRWHRANCLEKLERHAEIKPELDAMLRLKPDYAPAIVKRVKYTLDEAYAEDDEGLSDAERGRREAERLARERAISLEAETELRRALEIEADNVDALQLLSEVLRYRDNGEARIAEADALLDRAITLAPARVDLVETRANVRRGAALRPDEGPDDADTVRTYSGMRYSRSKLEAALADYETCHALSGAHRYAVRMGMVLHDLGRFDEALARYDQALAAMAPDDPKRQFVLDTRARSQNQGAGEREEMAKLLESALVGEGKDRGLADDMAAQALLGAASAIRAGKSVGEALEARLSEDPETLLATNIAQQILNAALEPPPEIEAVDAKDYPAYQRNFVDRAAKEIGAIGLRTVGDAEAKGLFMTLGQHVLLRFFADDSGEVGVAAFALKPKWPGWLGFLIMFLSGKWKVASMVECVTQFEDGTHLSTQHENPSPFEHGGKIRIEVLPRKTTIRNLVAHHMKRVAGYKARHPESVALKALDIEGMDRRWREGQREKRAYRISVGYVTETELKRLLGAHYQRLADKVRRQLAVLAEDVAGSR